MEKHIAHRKNAIKKHVVKQPEVTNRELRTFEIWQPHSEKRLAAVKERIKRNDPMGSLMQYLLPRDFRLVALVQGNSFNDAHRRMERLCESVENNQVVVVDFGLRSATPGDVIAAAEGDAMYVSDLGLVTLSQALQR
ncbi:hypothetical protein [Botrimarina sp.]|uniref:hypothetical protein n=1 Tax=Botrimarina sp. TaxID=2795802 RepID=UPI0032EC0C12